MTDLFTLLPRKHDLPPIWDGLAVSWGQWQPIVPVMCRVPGREPCPGCGSSTSQIVMASGLLAMRPGVTVEEIDKHQRPYKIASSSLTALRCLGCQHDQVLDDGPDHDWTIMWDLGPEDYGDEGSNDPSGKRVDRRRWSR